MKTFTFIVVNSLGRRGYIEVKELSQKSAIKVANQRAKKLNLQLIY